MKKEELTQLPKETLSSLLDICRRNWRSVDGRWFLAVEDSCGLERATEIDCDVWSQLGKVTAGRLQKAFSLGEGIPALAKALELDPGFLYYEYIVKQTSQTTAIWRVTSCLAQEGRIKSGRELLDCRRLDEPYLTNCAQVFCPGIRVRCEFCPPERHSADVWCEWHFSLEGEAQGGKRGEAR